MTETLRRRDPRDRRIALAATGLLRRVQRGRACWARPTCTSPPDSAPCSGRTTRQVLLAAALAVRAVRAGSVCVDLGPWRTCPVEALTADGEPLPWPEPAAVARGGRGRARWCATRCCGCVGLDAALPRPLLARGGPGLRRPARPDCRHAPPAVDRSSCSTPACSRRLPRRRRPSEQRRAAPSGRVPLDHRARPVDPAPGRPPPWPVSWRCSPSSRARGRPPPRIALAAPTGKAAARLQAAVQEAVEPISSPAGPATRPPRRAAAVHPAPAAGLATRQPGPRSGTTAATGCRTTWSWSTRRRWSR